MTMTKKQILDNTVKLELSRDEVTFVLNLIEREQIRLLRLIHETGTGDMTVGESNLVYQDKATCCRIAPQFMI